jgi:hypothetical protein
MQVNGIMMQGGFDMERKVYIYCLSDPKTGTVRYIGATTDPKRRAYEHSRPYNSTSKILGSWRKNLTLLKRKPLFTILEVVPYEEGIIKEGMWIEWCFSQGVPILNMKRISSIHYNHLPARMVQ